MKTFRIHVSVESYFDLVVKSDLSKEELNEKGEYQIIEMARQQFDPDNSDYLTFEEAIDTMILENSDDGQVEITEEEGELQIEGEN